ncbi:MAG TPA: outer membrane beta-barrel family protein [Fluviicola sp.]|nr:outer membrane beta-barrel family protein [Fluviicola sp.]
MLKRITLLLPVLLLLQVASAQSKITGTIVDEEQKPIEFVMIILSDTNDVFLKGEVSNDLGQFEIMCERGIYHLHISSGGDSIYNGKIEVDSIDISLGEIRFRPKSLDEVVVTAQKPIYGREFDKLIFYVENSPLKQGYDGLEVLKRSPKIQVNAQGDILMRNASVLVMVNGRRMTMSGQELASYLASLNSENIKSIEIQTSGGSETDAERAGGVVNIVLKKNPKGFQTTARTFYKYRDRNADQVVAGLNTQFSANKWYLYHRINYNTDRNKSTYHSALNYFSFNGRNENSGNLRNSKSSLINTFGTVYYPNSKHEIGVEGFVSNTESGRKGTEYLDVYDPALVARSRNDMLNADNTLFWNTTLNYTYRIDSLGSSLKVIGDIGNNAFDNNNEVDSRYEVGTNTDNHNQFVTDANSTFYNLQADWTRKSIRKWVLMIGSKAQHVDRSNMLNRFLELNGQWQDVPTGNENFRNAEWIAATYFNIAKTFREKHDVKIGFRGEYTDLTGQDYQNNTSVNRSYFNLFPSVYYGYKLKDENTLSFSYNRRIQRPSFRDLNPFVIKQNDFLYQIGNPNLKPQFSDHFDVTCQLEKQAFALFADVTNNLITGVYTNDTNVAYYQPQNFGQENRIGVEYNYYGYLTKWFYLNFYASAWHYYFQTGDLEFSRVVFYNSISTNIRFSKTFTLDLTHNYTSKNQFGIISGAYQYRLDLMLQKTFLKEALTLRVYVDDVFNTQRDKNTSVYSGFTVDFYQKPITRSYTLLMLYTFKNKGKMESKTVENDNENKGRL